MRIAQRQRHSAKLAGGILLVALSVVAFAQTSSNQIWPEVDSYYPLNAKYRLKVAISRSTDGNTCDSVAIGPTLNIFAKRFVHPRLTTPNTAKDHLLTFGGGYLYLAGVNQAAENRIVLDATPQIPLPWSLQASDRNRVDLRSVEGSGFSWRYRNCVTVQRTFKIQHLVFSPYAQAEFYYSRDSRSWNKTTLQTGVDIPLGKRFDFEPYYGHDNNKGSSPNHVNAVRLTLSIYF
jgi:Protein of unknown function (DUF2490)